MTAPEGETQVTIARGSVYLTRELCDRHLPGISNVALLQRDHALLVLPLQHTANGGLLLKQRNARGDRVLHAAEFLRAQGYADDAAPQTLPVYWDAAAAALVIAAPQAALPPSDL